MPGTVRVNKRVRSYDLRMRPDLGTNFPKVQLYTKPADCVFVIVLAVHAACDNINLRGQLLNI